MLLDHIPALRLQTDETLPLLRVEWLMGPDTTQLRPAAAGLLALAHERSIRHLLIDMRTVPLLSVYDELWLGQHFMPGLVALGLQRLVLIVDSSQTFLQLSIDALHDLVQPAIRFDAQYFDDPTAALYWLADDDEAPVQHLLAEWATRRPSATPCSKPASR